VSASSNCPARRQIVPFGGRRRVAPEDYLRTAIECNFKGIFAFSYPSDLKIVIYVYKSEEESESCHLLGIALLAGALANAGLLFEPLEQLLDLTVRTNRE
jgi:hypothetical protein